MTDKWEKQVVLRNHRTLEERSFTLRLLHPGEEKDVMQCIYEEYGDSYYRREFYDIDLLKKITSSGKLNLFLATCGDEICGIQTIISHAPKETRLEAASQIFRKKYRGYDLPYELVKFTYEFARSLHPSCIYASCVVFHNITQKMCEEAGMVPVAFNFGSHLTSKMSNSFDLGTSEKYAQAIMIEPVDKTVAGDLYIHPEISETVSYLYSKLNVGYNIINTINKEHTENIDDKTSYQTKINDREQSICISVDRIGKDFHKVITEIRTSHSEKYWTIQLILPVDSSVSIKAYEELRREHFYFVGIRPLCCSQEQLFMQYTGDVYFKFDDFKLSDSFSDLLKNVLNYYEDR